MSRSLRARIERLEEVARQKEKERLKGFGRREMAERVQGWWNRDPEGFRNYAVLVEVGLNRLQETMATEVCPINIPKELLPICYDGIDYGIARELALGRETLSDVFQHAIERDICSRFNQRELMQICLALNPVHCRELATQPEMFASGVPEIIATFQTYSLEERLRTYWNISPQDFQGVARSYGELKDEMQRILTIQPRIQPRGL